MVMRVLIAAGGTGGHVYPALAVAERLRAQAAEVSWLGSRHGLEARVVPAAGIELDMVPVRGLRGNGWLGWLLAPFRLGLVSVQTLAVMLRRRPTVVVGFGGFVAGPAGVVARLLRLPLVIHEQNARPGLTNRWLARIATRVLEAFPHSFPPARRPTLTGNPLRRGIAAVADEPRAARRAPPHLLVLGGSLGARAINERLPEAIAGLSATMRPVIRHQAGPRWADECRARYAGLGVAAEVVPYFEDMDAQYRWADVAVCRAGAMTVAELACAGLPALLIPYPYAADDHQAANAHWFADAGAGIVRVQAAADAATLRADLERLLDPAGHGARSAAARALAITDADDRVVAAITAAHHAALGRPMEDAA